MRSFIKLGHFCAGVVLVLTLAACTGESTSSGDNKGNIYIDRTTYIFGLPLLKETEYCSRPENGVPVCTVFR